MPRLRTDWICVATAGKTADGREIKEEWLQEAADTYNPQTYTALIWPRHDTLEARAWSYNYGEVAGLKAERVDGVLKLFAQLMPNDWLIATNESGQKLFTSIEVVENFAGTGKYYLFGLAVTDIPASLGTDRLMFSMGSTQSALEQGGAEMFSLGELREVSEEAKAREKNFLQRFFSRNKDNPPQTKDEDEMTKEQFDALMGRMDTQDAAITGIQEQVKAFSVGNQPADPQKQEIKPEDKPTTVITAEQFTQLEGKLDGLVQKFEQVASANTTKKPDENPGEENKVWL
ncbi:phage capsid protein [Citrobacter sp. S39]|uniref:GPO family capsid scaffolding protein n=1 Tax=Citrobacter TaxID=544 RepID=UPI0012A90A4F|nr:MULTISPECIES: GPO family capsid scaffolding protein [Citrobacter]MDX7507474.1 GPO family capsid scaffolding protein [Citrobacter freundii]QFX90705.1 phage capsid protein [Citrobacter sp. S39]HED1545430.1 GPO family capsid scaffolding protein [Citrobacter freundii]